MELMTRGQRLIELGDLITPMALRAAAELRLADLLEKGESSPEEIAAKTATAVRPMRKLLKHLAAVGVAQEGENGKFSLGELGEPLLSANDPYGFRPTLDPTNLSGRAEMAMTNLTHTLRTGEPAYNACYGRDYWSDLESSPTPIPGHEDALNAPPGFDSDLVVNGYDWSRVSSVVDVGGSGGALLSSLLLAHPHLTGTLLDLSKAARSGLERFSRMGLADRTDVVAGSFFDPLPEGADLYLLSSILVDWQDVDAVSILRGCARAAGSNGRVLVAEIDLSVFRQGLDPMTRSRVDLRLEASMANPDRDPANVRSLAERAGLEVVWESENSGTRFLIELRGTEG
ncbi:methyltransferase [Nocardiopsis sp. CC223A]|uniref:methyltransferase n=1 Tax=Nocardiopsis sp. CC223A TaxID=3044051 RepID=UPI00278C2176|nr:methyltransferase [Nocardiopsis sp. CC223A]